LNVPTILWGANFYSNRLPLAGWLVWDKRHGIEAMEFNRSDAELAFFSESRTVKTYRHLWHGICRATEVGDHLHPTQKPVALMRWCLDQFKHEVGVVLDPYMGSGTTLVAAKQTGRRAIGIEIEERYCEIAAKRLSQDMLPLEVNA
jgi:DNA modification methylase